MFILINKTTKVVVHISIKTFVVKYYYLGSLINFIFKYLLNELNIYPELYHRLRIQRNVDV